MRILIQRVKKASLTIDHKLYAEIKKGLLIFVGIHKDDHPSQAEWLAEKCLHLRPFDDSNGKMNLSVQHIQGEILIISQFTLYGSCIAGRRPKFTDSARGISAQMLYSTFVQEVKKRYLLVQTGIFGTKMEIELLNDGPVTFMVEK